MGPLATVDFLHKLVRATPADADQDHVPLVVRFCPEVPDRVQALLHGGPSPAPALVAAAQALQAAGAQCLAMPCHTAHAWYDELAAGVGVPVLHIADVAIAAAAGHPGGVGLLCTLGTRQAGIYRRRGPGVAWVESSADEQDRCVGPGIRAAKLGRLAQACELLGEAARALVRRGAGVVLMGCTEIPLALTEAEAGVPLVDPTDVLARACVAWALEGAR
jgi:aspartate racemase